MKALRIRFQGRDDLILFAASVDEAGPIATAEQFAHGCPSYAYLAPNGTIMRFGAELGTRADLEVLGPCEPALAEDALKNMLDERLWPAPGEVRQ